jgi:hypothetical protein
MTKMHFLMFAWFLKTWRQGGRIPEDVMFDLVDTFAVICRDFNPNFSKARFLEAVFVDEIEPASFIE